jgi:cation diffusion facilitator family transporter
VNRGNESNGGQYLCANELQGGRKAAAVTNSAEEKGFRLNRKTMVVVLLVSTALMVVKFYAYWITGSSAIFSDALESIINVVANAFALWSVLVSAKPPDESHPYGHGKIEFFSAGFEGALIILAAVGIFQQGLHQILHPQDLLQLQEGLYILIGAGAVNLVLALVLIRVANRTRSLVLVADGRHILTDVYTSGGVFIGLVLVHFTAWYSLDGVVACVVGVNIVIAGAKLVREAFGGLMDTSDPALLDEISSLLALNRKTIWIDVHRLRAWRSGRRVHVDFHLILPRDMPLEEGHGEVKDLEAIFDRHFGGLADVLIHLDPCTDPECPVCWLDPCDTRRERRIGQRTWHRDALTSDAPAERPNSQSEPNDRGKN